MTNMSTKYVFGFVLVAGAVWAADSVPPLDVRLGMWESTMTMQTSGAPPIPPELLAKMTPEQKAMLEARMKAGPKTTVNKHCVTKEDLNKGLNFGEVKGSCQRTVVNASSSKQEFRFECSNAGIKSSGTIRVEAVDPEHVKVSSQFTSGDGSHAMNINATGAGKWVSAECVSDSKK